MNFMDYFNNDTQDVSGVPANDELAQLELKRRLARADALRGQQGPQGQMIGNLLVTPSWTQQLAHAYDKYQAGQEERGAMKQYGEYTKTKAQKQADALSALSGALEPKQVEQYADYNESGNMPLVETKSVNPTAASLTQALLNYGKDTGQPNIGEKAVMSRIEAMNKDKSTPIKGAAGDVFFDPVTHEELFSVPGKPMSELSNIQPDPVTGKFYGFNKANQQMVEVPSQNVTPKAPEIKAPPTRTRPMGDMEVQEVLVGAPTKDKPEGVWKPTGSPVPRFKPESDSAKDTLNFNRTNKLRDDFSSLPEVKSWNVIQPILTSVRQAAKDNSGGSDLNLIYGMGKVMDPNSVVREGEMTFAANTGSLGQKIAGYYKDVVNGGKLTPAVKADLLRQIESRAEGQRRLYENTKNLYTKRAKDLNLNPQDLFVEGITAPPSMKKVINGVTYVNDGQGWHKE